MMPKEGYVANSLPNEKELYARIKTEQIRVSPEIWDLLYNHIGDNLTAINLLCQYYLHNNKLTPIEEAKKILLYCRHIKDINNKLTVVTDKDAYFPELGDSLPLHPVIIEMLTHYIGNDVYMINLAVKDSIDPLDPRPLSIGVNQKILGHTRSIKEFMERLRIATTQEETPKPKEIPHNSSNPLTKDQIFQRIRTCLAQEFKLNEDKIKLLSLFREDLGFDSVDTLRVVMVLEEAFDLEIPDDVPDKILTVAEAVDYIFKNLPHP